MATDDELVEVLRRALDAAPAEPPVDRVAAIRQRAAALATEGTVTALPRRRGSARLLRAAAAVIVALGIGVGVGSVLDPFGGDDPEGVLEFAGTLTAPGDGGARADVAVRKTGIGRVVHLESDELPVLPTGEFYELWFVAPGDSGDGLNRISAGTFHPDEQGRTSVRFAAAVDPTKYPVLSVTAEPGDGDPEPTGPEVLRATISPG